MKLLLVSGWATLTLFCQTAFGRPVSATECALAHNPHCTTPLKSVPPYTEEGRESVLVLPPGDKQRNTRSRGKAPIPKSEAVKLRRKKKQVEAEGKEWGGIDKENLDAYNKYDAQLRLKKNRGQPNSPGPSENGSKTQTHSKAGAQPDISHVLNKVLADQKSSKPVLPPTVQQPLPAVPVPSRGSPSPGRQSSPSNVQPQQPLPINTKPKPPQIEPGPSPTSAEIEEYPSSVMPQDTFHVPGGILGLPY